MSQRPLPLRRLALYTPAVLVALLLIPCGEHPVPDPAPGRPFLWNQDARWESLEHRFSAMRSAGCGERAPLLDSSLRSGRSAVELLSSGNRNPDDTLFPILERLVFGLAADCGACPSRVPEFIDLVVRLQMLMKDQSAAWDLASPSARATLYRIIYGGRMASEEALLQTAPGAIPPLVTGRHEPSRTPSARILGLLLHSGDILVSRGGAPTSALIARGNDYPGNFSHVALLHVDSATGMASIIESHIERGVAVAGEEEYLRDTKLRVMVLRLRADLPAMVADPFLPHRAATRMLEEAQRRHIPYDFAMDFTDSRALFCSEVVSAAYRLYGVNLWMGVSRISSPGVASWLAAFGVRHFETQEPSDLEYDPQLSVVAEWRDPQTLFVDHVDNAVTDAMLEGAERGEALGYDWYLLPWARAAKAYSVLLNAFGGVGPVPEGMDATAALKHREFSARHGRARSAVRESAEAFRLEHGYVPPYWELLKLARAAVGRR